MDDPHGLFPSPQIIHNLSDRQDSPKFSYILPKQITAGHFYHMLLINARLSNAFLSSIQLFNILLQSL